MMIKLNKLSMAQVQAPSNVTQSVEQVQQAQIWCQVCGGSDHYADLSGANPESDNFIGNAQRGSQDYSNTYN